MKTSDVRESLLKRIQKLRGGKKPRIENGAISYVKKPFAQHSRYSLGCALIAFVLALVCVGISVYYDGAGNLSVGAWGFSSILFAVAGFVYGLLSFAEPDTSSTLAKIGIAICGILLIFWLSMIAVGVML